MEERLQKIIANAGFASRRAAEKLIVEGRVSVNNIVVRQLGTRANWQKDEIRIDGRLISCDQEKLYLLLYKPRGYVTTLSDPQGRPIITTLLPGIQERVFPVGRLDYDSEGLLILTNDGDFAYKLQHPKFGIPKTYRIKINGRMTPRNIRAFESGIELPDGLFRPDKFSIEKSNRKSCWLTLTISEGRNRIIRRALESMGYSVVRLIRTSINSVEFVDLKEGAFRHLNSKEIRSLKAATSLQSS
jgi:23S rRNA pseudouridine2605 synthase